MFEHPKILRSTARFARGSLFHMQLSLENHCLVARMASEVEVVEALDVFCLLVEDLEALAQGQELPCLAIDELLPCPATNELELVCGGIDALERSSGVC